MQPVLLVQLVRPVPLAVPGLQEKLERLDLPAHRAFLVQMEQWVLLDLPERRASLVLRVR